MIDYKAGDLIPLSALRVNWTDAAKGAMVVRKIPFKEVCDRADDKLLEYDIDDMWEAWNRTGCYEILYEGDLVWWWPKDLEQGKE